MFYFGKNLRKFFFFVLFTLNNMKFRQYDIRYQTSRQMKADSESRVNRNVDYENNLDIIKITFKNNIQNCEFSSKIQQKP